jgi:hypothetical protein
MRGEPVLVPELNSPYEENTTDIRRDGLEFFLVSSRPDGLIGLIDIWVSTQDSTLDPWSTPVSLGPTVNYPGYTTGRPALSCERTTLYFYATVPAALGRETSTSPHAKDQWTRGAKAAHESTRLSDNGAAAPSRDISRRGHWGGHRGAPWPVSLAYPGGRLLPLKLRAFIDFAAPRLKSALFDGSDRSRSPAEHQGRAEAARARRLAVRERLA